MGSLGVSLMHRDGTMAVLGQAWMSAWSISVTQRGGQREGWVNLGKLNDQQSASI